MQPCISRLFAMAATFIRVCRVRGKIAIQCSGEFNTVAPFRVRYKMKLEVLLFRIFELSANVLVNQLFFDLQQLVEATLVREQALLDGALLLGRRLSQEISSEQFFVSLLHLDHEIPFEDPFDLASWNVLPGTFLRARHSHMHLRRASRIRCALIHSAFASIPSCCARPLRASIFVLPSPP